jgi:hypothetical protein
MPPRTHAGAREGARVTGPAPELAAAHGQAARLKASVGNQAMLRLQRAYAGAGEPLPSTVRGTMEHAFDRDLSDVRVHADEHAAAAVDAMNARAATVGRHIAFGTGMYDPVTRHGLMLLAHELAHTVQQGHGEPTSAEPRSRDDASEHEARAAAAAVVGGRRVAGLRSTSVALAFDQAPTTYGAAMPPARVRIQLLEEAPWMFAVEGLASDAEITREIYGADLSEYLQGIGEGPLRRYLLDPELLKPEYRARFDGLMRHLVDRDVLRVKRILDDRSPDLETLGVVARWWAARRDLRGAGGISYFDVWLTRLRNERATDGRSCLDLLYDRGGLEMITLVATSSTALGAYRPLASLLPGPGRAPAAMDNDVIKRSSDAIMDRLAGATSATASHEVLALLRGLPPAAQAQVLQHFMKRYDEPELVVFSRSGERSQVNMLYWLFEDLTEADRKDLGASLRTGGLLTQTAVDALVEGRPLAGRYLPYTTDAAREATEWYADRSIRGGPGGAAAAVGGAFSSLWLPHTATATVMTLGTAALGPKVLPMLPARVGQAVVLLGTGAGAFGTTIAAQEAITGRNVWTGRPLAPEDRLGRALEAVAGVLFLAAGFLGALQAQAQARNVAALPGPRALARPLGGTAPAPTLGNVRVLSFDPESGELLAIGRHPATGEFIRFQLNVHTGRGTIFNLSTGQTAGYFRGWVDGFIEVGAAPVAALPQGAPAPTAPPAPPPTVPPPPVGAMIPQRPALPVSPPAPKLPPSPPVPLLPPGQLPPVMDPGGRGLYALDDALVARLAPADAARLRVLQGRPPTTVEELDELIALRTRAAGKPGSLTAGTPEHMRDRWDRYLASTRPKHKRFEAWAKGHAQRMANSVTGLDAEAEWRLAFEDLEIEAGASVVKTAAGKARQVDMLIPAAEGEPRTLIQLKSGANESLTTTARRSGGASYGSSSLSNADALALDADLVVEGNRVIWIFEKTPSGPLIAEAVRSDVKVFIRVDSAAEQQRVIGLMTRKGAEMMSEEIARVTFVVGTREDAIRIVTGIVAQGTKP